MDETDPDRIKRIGDLAKQLFEYKLAQNMEDAYSQAQRIVENESNLIVKKVGEKYVDPMKERMGRADAQQKKEDVYAVSGFSDSNDLRKLKVKVEDVEKTLNAVMVKMNEMIAEINKLQQQRPVIQGQSQLVAEQGSDKKKVVGVKLPDGSVAYPTSKEDVHPRTGSYTSADVSVDKMFNFSGGRR